MAELQNTIDQCITITTEQCPNQTTGNQLLSNQANQLLCNCKNKTTNTCNNECANKDEKSIKPGLSNKNHQLASFLNNSPNSNQLNSMNFPNSNLVAFNNSNLATSTTTTKLQLSIAPTTASSTKRHHRHHSASAMMNCTSSFLLGDQTFTTTTQPILCNATTNIKLGHHRSISTSTIHHHLHLHHLNNNLNNVTNVNYPVNPMIQTQDKQPLIMKQANEDELKLDFYKKDNKNEDFDSSMDSCSLVSSCPSERKLKDIPSCMWSLLTNPIYIITCLGSCMELCIVSGFLVFLPKYLETQFSISKSQANLYSGGIAVPGNLENIYLIKLKFKSYFNIINSFF